jgi:hypothetical protein
MQTGGSSRRLVAAAVRPKAPGPGQSRDSTAGGIPHLEETHLWKEGMGESGRGRLYCVHDETVAHGRRGHKTDEGKAYGYLQASHSSEGRWSSGEEWKCQGRDGVNRNEFSSVLEQAKAVARSAEERRMEESQEHMEAAPPGGSRKAAPAPHAQRSAFKGFQGHSFDGEAEDEGSDELGDAGASGCVCVRARVGCTLHRLDSALIRVVSAP